MRPATRQLETPDGRRWQTARATAPRYGLTAPAAGLLALLLAAPAGPAAAQDRPLEVSGNVYAGYTGSHDTTAETDAVNTAGLVDLGRLREFELGLDLHTGYFIITPKFITLTADLNFSTFKSKVGGADSGRGVQGQAYTASVLPNSPYPFRFLYSTENSDYRQRDFTNLQTHDRDLRWDWQLRLRAFPRVSVTYDSRVDRTGLLSDALHATKGRGLSVTASDTVFGFDVNGSFDRHKAEYGVSSVSTSFDTERLDVHKSFNPDSVFSMHASHQSTNFDATGIVTGQNFSFYDVRTEYDKRFKNRLSLQVYHQFFSNTTVSQLAIAAPTSAAKGLFSPAAQQAAPAMTAAPVVDVAVAAATGWTDPTAPLTTGGLPGGWTGMFAPPSATADRSITVAPTQSIEVATHSSTLGAQLSYALIPSVTVGGGLSVSSIAPPNGPVVGLFEQATRLVDAQVSLTWGQRIGFLNARAGGTYGVSSAKSNYDQRGRAPFYSATGGLSVGNTNRVLVWADANYLHREDVYMVNGYANETAYSGGIEAQLLPSLHFTGTAGVSNFDEITPDGRENYRRTLYALGLEHRIVSLQFSQSTNVGDRDVFSVPFDQGIGRLFYLLPVDTLVPDPLGRTWSRYTQGVARFRFVRDLDLEARYIDNDSQFVLTQDIAARQLEALATYRLGRFTFHAGVLVERLAVEGSPVHKRTQYFARVSRAFRIF